MLGGTDVKTLRHDLTLQAMQLVNVILMTVPFTICWFGYYAGKSVLPMSRTTMWLPVLAFVVLYIILGRVYDAFLGRVCK